MSDQRDRDERGRFIKGNPHRFIAGTEKPSNGGKVGGVISGESKRRNKMLKEELREILNGDPETYLKTVTEYKPLDS